MPLHNANWALQTKACIKGEKPCNPSTQTEETINKSPHESKTLLNKVLIQSKFVILIIQNKTLCLELMSGYYLPSQKSVLYLRLFLLNHPFLSVPLLLADWRRQTGTMWILTPTCSVKLAQAVLWIVCVVWLWMRLHVPVDIVGHGQRRCAGHEGCRRGADFCRVRLQAHLLVVVQLADDDAAEVFGVSVTVVQELANLGCACRLVHH